MSNVIAKGISSTLKTAEKEAVRANIDAPSNAEMTAVEGRATTLEDDVSELSTANNSRTKTALNATGSAPIFACRAWVNFNGTGTVAIRGGGNVSSITDNGAGNYIVNLTEPMPSLNYVWSVNVGMTSPSTEAAVWEDVNLRTLSSFNIRLRNVDGLDVDREYVMVTVHG